MATGPFKIGCIRYNQDNLIPIATMCYYYILGGPFQYNVLSAATVVAPREGRRTSHTGGGGGYVL